MINRTGVMETPCERKVDMPMPDDAVREAVSKLANALQVMHGLVTTLRRDLSASHQHALDLEKSMWTAVGALRRLQPKGGA